MDEPTGEAREGRVIGRIPTDTFAHRLMLARSEAGHLTIQQAAAKCGLKHQSWSNWERGMEPRGDKVELAEAIAEGLEIDRDWLLFGGQLTQPVRPNRRGGRLIQTYGGSTHPGVRRPRRINRARRHATV